MKNQKQFIFNENEWYTPNTYNSNFKSPSNKSGVYLIVLPIFDLIDQVVNYDIVYIGSAKDLLNRYKSHEVLRFLKNNFNYVQFYFNECIDYKNAEKNLIKLVQPKLNKQWR